MQSKRMSIVETCVSTAIGFVISFITTQIVLPFYGYHVTLSENGQITAIFTVISLVRGFYVRRLFNYLHKREQETRQSFFAAQNTRG